MIKSNDLIAEDIFAENERLKSKCQIFTPVYIVEKMLQLAEYQYNLAGKKVLENSCGNGEILIQVVKRYVNDSILKSRSSDEIIKGLEKDIVAYEIDPDRANECKDRLNRMILEYGLSSVQWDIRTEDYLWSVTDERFDYIISNPPYISYADLSKKTRNEIKKHFSTCSKGKFDYYYAFIEKSYKELTQHGRLVYLIPNGLFKNVFGDQVRNLIKDELDIIIDYGETKIFHEVLVAPSIFRIQKNTHKPDINIYINEEKQITLKKEDLAQKWYFNKLLSCNKKIGDSFRISMGVATLCNNVFLLRQGRIDGNYYLFHEGKIEREILRRAASTKQKRLGNEEYIIFPYYYDNGLLMHYEDNEIKKRFPNAWEYLNKHRKELDKRASDRCVKWYEYGRTQALQWINQKKILLSNVISDHTEAYLIEADEIPYAGFFIIPTGKDTLENLLPHFSSERFKEYIKNIGISVSGKSKRVSPKDIEEYPLEL